MTLPDRSSLVCASDFQGSVAVLDDQILVYQPVSGSIQLVDMLGYEVLKLIYEQPLTVSQLASRLNSCFDTDDVEDLESAILKVINQFQAVDLVEQC